MRANVDPGTGAAGECASSNQALCRSEAEDTLG
jgi:hypothetical protein